MTNRLAQFACLSALLLSLVSCGSPGPSRNSTPDSIPATVYYNAGDVVTKGYMDRSGNVWFTTSQEGIFKYDGESFRNWTVADGLCGNEVWAIQEDSRGILWLGTENGLCRFDGDRFETTRLPKVEVQTDWLTETYPGVNPEGVSSLWLEDDGTCWIGSNGAGVYHYDGKTFTPYLQDRGALMPDSLPHNVIVTIFEDQAGNLWMGSFSHGGVSKYDGETFTHYGTAEGVGDDMISSGYVDAAGRVWFGTRKGGMSYLDGDSFVTIQQPEGPCHNNMTTLLEDRSGRLWVASYARSGVCWYENGEFIPLEIEHSDQLVDIKCMVEDRQGNIWFGGRYGILWRYDGEQLTDFTQRKRQG